MDAVPHASLPPTLMQPTATTGIVAAFHPGWFAAVMGTGIVAVAASLNPGRLPALAGPATAVGQLLAVLALGIALVLAGPYLARWIRHPAAARADFTHPLVGALYGTFPAGILVLGAVAAAIGPSALASDLVVELVGAAALVGGLIGIGVGVAGAYALIVTPDVPGHAANGAWFIPPVIPIILPLLFGPLIPHVAPAEARLLLALGYGALGMGFLLFLLVGGLVYGRLVQHPLPAASLAPTLWIGLGPIGVASLALLRLASVGGVAWGAAAPAVTAVSSIAAVAIWGLGVWWFLLALLLLRRYVRSGGVPYGLGWWAFTFPLGAYTVATLTLARNLDVVALEVVGVGLFLLLCAFWLTVTLRTVGAIRSGEVFRR